MAAISSHCGVEPTKGRSGRSIVVVRPPFQAIVESTKGRSIVALWSPFQVIAEPTKGRTIVPVWPPFQAIVALNLLKAARATLLLW